MIKKEFEILYLFAKEPWKKYTYSELQKTSKIKSKSYLENFFKKFVKEEILIQNKVGSSSVYFLNLSSLKTRIFAGFILEYFGWSSKNIPYKKLEEIFNKIPYKDYIFLITGSYVGNKETKKSDLDIVILIDDSFDPKKVYAELRFKCETMIPKIHLYVFKNSEFTQMSLNEEANYGKEILKNNLVICQGQNYLNLIKEVIKNGFNDKNLS